MTDHPRVGNATSGIALPMVLIIMAALLVLALAAISMTGIEHQTSRTWVEQSRAKLAVQAGREEVEAAMLREMANDDFIVLQADGLRLPGGQSLNVQYPFIARAVLDQGNVRYRHVPLFSWGSSFPVSDRIDAPVIELLPQDLDQVAHYETLPWCDEVKLAWRPIVDESRRVIARYAYWVEDLQGRLDPRHVGNDRGENGAHLRAAYPFSAAGVSDLPASAIGPVLDQVALYPLSPLALEDDQGTRVRRLLQHRKGLLSPESAIAVAGNDPPLVRRDGVWADETAKAMDKSLIVGIHAYQERPQVPYVPGIDVQCMGKPKLNLNRLLAVGGNKAVSEMADWMDEALPEFDTRKGGLTDDYLKTLAANALDYGDTDDMPTSDGLHYSGIDAFPLLSEIVIHIHFQKQQLESGRWVLKWRFRLFAELWNMSNHPVNGGQARVSYEVNLRPTPMGTGGVMRPFDDPAILTDPRQSQHHLERIGGLFFSPPVEVSLLPDEYRFYEFATVDYTLDCVPQLDVAGVPVVEMFDLAEPEHQARGMTLMWNGVPVQRIPKMLRDPYGLSDFRTDKTRKAAKACIPGLNYGGYGEAVNNPGDPRIAMHLRDVVLGENAYPENVSPHRRNIRRRNIYDKDPSPLKSRHYGRVLPSQWPDGGHDSDVDDFLVTTSDAALPSDESKWPLCEVPKPLAGNAPQRISNAGRFFSATELGRIFDPILWQAVYPDLPGQPGSGAEDAAILIGQPYGPRLPTMPERRQRWPEVSVAAVPGKSCGGGNTLRIGRPEHGKFDQPGMRASDLLDLFHAGIATSDVASDREGHVVNIQGHVNLNTAGRDVLRCLAAGRLVQDPGLCRVADWAHDTHGTLHPATRAMDLDAPTAELVADRIADAIMRSRPFASPSQLAQARGVDGLPVFGNPAMHEDPDRLQWSDAAAEEVFGRVYEASTVRSRNFRVWVVGQSLGGKAEAPEVLAESRRVFTLFADPGERRPDGSLESTHQRMRVLYERSF